MQINAGHLRAQGIKGIGKARGARLRWRPGSQCGHWLSSKLAGGNPQVYVGTPGHASADSSPDRPETFRIAFVFTVLCASDCFTFAIELIYHIVDHLSLSNRREKGHPRRMRAEAVAREPLTTLRCFQQQIRKCD